MSDKLLKINDLAFELQHDDELSAEQFWKIKQIFELSVQYQLNENQQIVLEWLKEEKVNSNLTLFDCIYSFIYGNPEDLVTQFWTELNEKEEAQVLEAFSQWDFE